LAEVRRQKAAPVFQKKPAFIPRERQGSSATSHAVFQKAPQLTDSVSFFYPSRTFTSNAVF